jgi:nitrile hydratase
MNSVHDMGGMHNMGPIAPEADEPVFHAPWERRAFALTLAAGFLGKWNLDASRFARELMPPADYLGTTYYEHWLYGLERLLVEHGLLTRAEIEARRRTPAAGGPPTPATGARVLRAADVDKVLRTGGRARRADAVPPRFEVGDRVRARTMNPTGHTRLPRYARGREGRIERDHGVFVFADSHAMGLGADPQHVYSVRFAARELWGPEASSRDAVYIDLWDDHLEQP